MTNDEARVLDVLVAEKVLGLAPCDKWSTMSLGSAGGRVMTLPKDVCPHGNDGRSCYPAVPGLQWPGNGGVHYSEFIQAAWPIWLKFAAREGWELRALGPESENVGIWQNGKWIAGDCPAPEAICRAALKAVGATEA